MLAFNRTERITTVRFESGYWHPFAEEFCKGLTGERLATTERGLMFKSGLPGQQGLYDPANEHDNCGIGFVANIKNRKTNEIVKNGLTILDNLTHRGVAGADPLTEMERDFIQIP